MARVFTTITAGRQGGHPGPGRQHSAGEAGLREASTSSLHRCTSLGHRKVSLEAAEADRREGHQPRAPGLSRQKRKMLDGAL